MLATILVALDCSETSEQVIKALESLKISSQSQIILCHVLPSPAIDSDIVPDQPHPSLETLQQNAEKLLRTHQGQFPKSEIEIVSGDAAEEIIRLANIYQVDLIVIGTRGLTGVKRIIEGSVSSQVVADSPCSVLVVKC